MTVNHCCLGLVSSNFSVGCFNCCSVSLFWSGNAVRLSCLVCLHFEIRIEVLKNVVLTLQTSFVMFIWAPGHFGAVVEGGVFLQFDLAMIFFLLSFLVSLFLFLTHLILIAEKS